MKTWSNPINLDPNNLNRIELGIKNSHDALEIVSEEVANLQTKQFDILKDLKVLTKDAPNILTTLESLQEILNTNDMSAILNTADSFLTKSSQDLSSSELEQVYKNLKLNTFLKLTDIKVNNSSIVNGSEANITIPAVDTSLNINSVNAVTNKAITKAINDIKESLKHIDLDVEVPTKLSQLTQDSTHLLTTQTEKDLWNSYKDLFLLKEDYKESENTYEHNHDNLYAPLKHTHEEIIAAIPVVPTNISGFINDLNYATEDYVKANGGKIDSITINGVVQTIIDKNVNIKVPTDLNELTNSPGYITDYIETDPTVPDWAKTPTKPYYEYSEILNAPTIPTDNNQLSNGAGYITETKASTLISDSLTTFKTSNITPLSNKLTSLESTDNTIIAELENKAAIDHTHTEYALASHNHNSLYSIQGHTHDEYKTYTDTAISTLVGSAPDTLNTLKELADAIEANSDIINALGNTYLKLSGGTLTGTLKLTTIEHSSSGQAITIRATSPSNSALNLRSGTSAESYLTFRDTNLTVLGQFGSNSSNEPLFKTSLDSEPQVLAFKSDIPTAYSAVYTGDSATKTSNATLSTLRIGYASSNLYIWNS
jgi:hypothetical protein